MGLSKDFAIQLHHRIRREHNGLLRMACGHCLGFSKRQVHHLLLRRKPGLQNLIGVGRLYLKGQPHLFQQLRPAGEPEAKINFIWISSILFIIQRRGHKVLL